MEGRPKVERVPDFSFLDEKLNVQLSVSAEAAPHFPKITAEDLISRKEKYRILLGETHLVEDSVVVHVSGVMEMTEDERGYYKEDVEVVSDINIPAIKALVAEVQKDPGYAGCSFIGDVHTHPFTEAEFSNGLKPWEPSPGDIESVVAMYEQGMHDSSKPFIFGIAAPGAQEGTEYAFYRLIKDEEGYRCVQIGI